MRSNLYQDTERTISGTMLSAVGVGGITVSCSRNPVLLKRSDGAYFSVHIRPDTGTTTEGAAQARLLALRSVFVPLPFLKGLFPSEVPTLEKFEPSRVRNSIWVGVRRRG